MRISDWSSDVCSSDLFVEQASSDTLYESPMHPYTKALMSAVPVPDPVKEATRERIILQGDLPSPAHPPTGCRFHTRCPFRQETKCDTERHELLERSEEHTSELSHYCAPRMPSSA